MFYPDILEWIGWPGVRALDGDVPSHIREVWIEDVYRCHHLDLQNKLVVDLGAAAGDFTLFCAQRGATVLAVEPQEMYYNQLLANLEHADLKKQVFTINSAVAPGYTNVSMRRSGQSAAIEYSEDGDISTIPLDDLIFCYFRDYDIELLKCDIEGSEWLIFPDFDFSHIRHLTMEFHGTDKEHWHDGALGGLLEHLSNTHAFSVIGSPRTAGGYIYANRHDV